MSRKARLFLLVAAALVAVWLVDYVLIQAQVPSAILYAVPVLLAASFLDEPEALALTAAAIALDILENWLTGTPPVSWVIGGATLALIGYLAFLLARQTRRAEETARENRRLYDEVRREARELERIHEEREAFLALVTHELRGILTVLTGHAQLLERAEVSETVRRRSIRAIAGQAQRMKRLLGDLSTVSTLEMGQFKIQKESCDLVAQARRAVRDHQALTERHQVILDAEVDELEGVWDCDRLRQVLDNLIRNAIKYSPHGGRVWVAVRARSGEAEFTVSDEGIGIPEMELPRLFHPYARAVEVGRFEGLGLGLYITKGIVEAHGGTIRVERRDGQGTTFRVVLPIPRGGEGETRDGTNKDIQDVQDGVRQMPS